MTHSMTGFGAAEGTNAAARVRIELKSLNSKGFEASFRLPRAYFAEELWLKNRLQTALQRGKVSCQLTVLPTADGPAGADLLDEALLRTYYRQLNAVGHELGRTQPPALELLLTLPGVVKETGGGVSEDEWALVQQVCDQAIAELQASRQHEGATLAQELESRVANIAQLLARVEPLEPVRAEAAKQRLQQQLQQHDTPLAPDDPRFAQEVVYYLERADITEERVRLASHLALFRETLASPEPLKGRKLGFIGQEMGREINTLGAKAYHPEIQRLVVEMKDELEKIKEQVNNVL